MDKEFETNLSDMPAGRARIFIDKNTPVQAIWSSDNAIVSEINSPVDSSIFPETEGITDNGIIIGTNKKN